MIRARKILHDVVRVTDVVCNKCGQTCRRGDSYEALKARVTWGLSSPKGSVSHQWEMCRECHDELIATFLIPPVVINNTDS